MAAASNDTPPRGDASGDRPGALRDAHGRPLGDLRLSVTDRCNLRCSYCMPEEDYAWLDKRHILDFEESSRIVDAFVALGVRKVRLTGGEPLLRRDLPTLVALLAQKSIANDAAIGADTPAIRDLAMTTNAVRLPQHAHALRDAGLHRLTISLDTLRRDRFRELTRRDALDEVLAGIRAAVAAGFADTANGKPTLKIDAVVIRGVNDDELADLIEFAKTIPAELRFIEYMDVGGATRWSTDAVVSRDEILDRLARRYGRVAPLPADSPSATATRYALPDDTPFGIISSTTAPFCRTCNRSRLTADGTWYLCLYAPGGVNLRDRLRAGASTDELRDLIADTWRARTDRGAEARLAHADRGPLIPADTLRRDPRLEMHTRGG